MQSKYRFSCMCIWIHLHDARQKEFQNMCSQFCNSSALICRCEELASLLNDCKQQVMKLQMLEGEIPSVSEKQNKIEELDRELRDFLKDLLLKSVWNKRLDAINVFCHPPQAYFILCSENYVSDIPHLLHHFFCCFFAYQYQYHCKLQTICLV